MGHVVHDVKTTDEKSCFEENAETTKLGATIRKAQELVRRYAVEDVSLVDGLEWDVAEEYYFCLNLWFGINSLSRC